LKRESGKRRDTTNEGAIVPCRFEGVDIIKMGLEIDARNEVQGLVNTDCRMLRMAPKKHEFCKSCMRKTIQIYHKIWCKTKKCS
jgi:hypothetical protein